jgi:MFS family permease
VRRFGIVLGLLEVQFWFPVWLLYLTRQGFSLTTIVAADAAFRLTVVVLELPFGQLADRIGRRRSLLLVAGITAFAHVAISTVGSTETLFAAWIVWGAAWAATSGTASAYLYELVRWLGGETERQRVFGRMRMVSSASVLLSLLLASALFEVDPRVPWWTTAALATAAGVIARRLPEVGSGAVTRRPLRAELLEAWGSARTRTLVVLAAGILVFGWSVRILFQPLLLEMGLGAGTSSRLYFGYATTALAAGWVVSRLRSEVRLRAAGFGAFVCVGGVYLTGAVPEWGPYLTVPLLGFGYHLATTLLELELHGASTDRQRATLLSLVSLGGGVIIVVARPVLGAFADRYGVASAFFAWAAIGVVLLLAMAPALRVLRRR